MNSIPVSLLETKAYDREGYQPLIDFASWRVALMNYTPDLVPEKIDQFQRHDETDEVFVLLSGKCILFLGEGGERISKIYAQDMEPYQLYNVKRGAWHSHTFSPDAKVLIVENSDTAEVNSPFIELLPDQRTQVISLTRKLWVQA